MGLSVRRRNYYMDFSGKTIRVRRQEPVLVRPAGETFNGLFLLSNLDQTFPRPIEVLLAFKTSKENAPQILKDSLAKVLVEFYPIAGCLARGWDDKILVRCTGEGVPFVEAVSDNQLDDVGDITILVEEKLRNFVCCMQDGVEDNILDVPLLQVQEKLSKHAINLILERVVYAVTTFKCGGMILGITASHVIADGRAFMNFMVSWAEVARSNPISLLPVLDRSLLSPRQPPKVFFPHHEYETKPRKKQSSPRDQDQEPYMYRSFCFTPEKLKQLKKMATDDQFRGPATSFEVIMALAWIFQTKGYKFKPNETTKLLIAVDGRPKFGPSFPEGFFGNAIGWACAQSKAGELLKKPFPAVVKMVHDAPKVVTEAHIRSAIDLYEVKRAELESENSYCASKWSKLAFYDSNFGWGHPSQVAPASLGNEFMVTLAQGKDSQNIILSLGLPQSAMEIFEELMLMELQRI
ncbi:unnamed protein product [Dovyalis caffra]|uniref:Uncharacterized protein n=1 Tax=Dovyalis caffra TaxID=77055 RepID=A0AAV1RPB6_9ROSI|nr:unnamed protein product [Dovyalis caffra]